MEKEKLPMRKPPRKQQYHPISLEKENNTSRKRDEKSINAK
jgi:hypothetical protein